MARRFVNTDREAKPEVNTPAGKSGPERRGPGSGRDPETGPGSTTYAINVTIRELSIASAT